MDKDFYKIYQLVDFFVRKYRYKPQLIREFKEFYKREMWLVNPENEHYQLIRITLNAAFDFDQDEKRVDTYLEYFKAYYKKDIRFLDIHISDDVYVREYEKYDFVNLDEDYHDGLEIDDLYPGTYDVVRNQDFSAEDYKIISSKADETIRKQEKIRKRFPFVTIIIIAICLIMYILELYFQRTYSDSAVLVFLGADYKTFTLGLSQYYRLFTAAFLHGGLLHLFSNMYSLFFLGGTIEKLYGRKYYLLVLIVSILTGSLSQSILSGNTLSIGISGGIYGLFVFLIFDLYRHRMVNLRSLMPLILVNLAINFLDAVAWKAHIGGMIGGIAVYLIFREEKKTAPLILLGILLIVLFMKYLSIDIIKPLYQGTDIEVIKMLEDLGYEKQAKELLINLAKVYGKYGG